MQFRMQPYLIFLFEGKLDLGNSVRQIKMPSWSEIYLAYVNNFFSLTVSLREITCHMQSLTTLNTATETYHIMLCIGSMWVKFRMKRWAAMINGWANLFPPHFLCLVCWVCACRKYRPQRIFNLEMIWAFTGEFLNKHAVKWIQIHHRRWPTHSWTWHHTWNRYLPCARVFLDCSLDTYGNADKHTSSPCQLLRSEFDAYADSRR